MPVTLVPTKLKNITELKRKCYNTPNLTVNSTAFYITLNYGLKKETKFSRILNFISNILTLKTQFKCQNLTIQTIICFQFQRITPLLHILPSVNKYMSCY